MRIAPATEHNQMQAEIKITSLTIFQVNMDGPIPLGYFLHLLQNRTFGDEWYKFLWAGCPFVSPNQQCQSTKDYRKQ